MIVIKFLHNLRVERHKLHNLLDIIILSILAIIFRRLALDLSTIVEIFAGYNLKVFSLKVLLIYNSRNLKILLAKTTTKMKMINCFFLRRYEMLLLNKTLKKD
jgi:hypothetical protein